MFGFLCFVPSSNIEADKHLVCRLSGAEGGLFELSENADFTNAYSVNCHASFCEIDNLKVAKTYYWRVNGGAARCFCTKDNAIRFIKIDGVLNVRDIGGKNIKQGLIYRGSGMYG